MAILVDNVGMETREAAERFARTWERGWRGHDVELLAPLYREDAVHRSMPFRPPHRGRTEIAEYIRWSFEDETVTDVRFGRPLVDGDAAVIEFRVLSAEDGRLLTLAGCVILHFDADGMVIEARDYWHVNEGHEEPG